MRLRTAAFIVEKVHFSLINHTQLHLFIRSNRPAGVNATLDRSCSEICYYLQNQTVKGIITTRQLPAPLYNNLHPVPAGSHM